MSFGDVCQLGDGTEGLKGVLHFSPAPENNPGIVSKTVDVSLYKEGNSFGFVLRGQCKSCPRGQGAEGSYRCFHACCFALMNIAIDA